MIPPIDPTAPPFDAVAGGEQLMAQENPEQDAEQKERDQVKKLVGEYNTAREFDKTAREQYAKDRKWASGRGNPDWASDANLIGSFIDILVSFLYAKNPDVSCRPPKRVMSQPTSDDRAFAETMEIVISRMWKDANLKKTARKMVRSALTVGAGWAKALMISETGPNPQVENALHDAQDNLKRLTALRSGMGEYYDGSEDPRIAEIENQMKGLQGNLEIVIRAGLTIDFCRAEDVQISLDVSDLTDYCDADWTSNRMYVPKPDLKSRFDRLDEEKLKKAASYYQRAPMAEAEDGEGSFVKGAAAKFTGGNKPVEFACIIELWDRRDNLVKTFVDGVEFWAVEPYAPPYASSRGNPYFMLPMYLVDGERHPQSLPFRLMKLQEEYASARSNGYLTRRRSIPGTVFNKGQLSPEDARKIENSEQMEMVGILPTNQDIPLQNVIVEKPIPKVDPAIFDTSAVRQDMEVMSGVQEAQQGSVRTAKTATEAEIQQSGFSSRTDTDRDSLEDVLRELALYTAETSVQCVPSQKVQRMAGPMAFWPFGMDREDLLTLCTVDIEAGSTGKPNSRGDQQAWTVILPQLQNMIVQIQQFDATNPALGQAMRALMSETLHRLDDRLDIDRFLPAGPPPVAPGLPGYPAAATPGLPTGAVDPAASNPAAPQAQLSTPAPATPPAVG